MDRHVALTLRELVVDHIHTTLYEEDWQWQPSLSAALENLTAAQAAWKPGPERHSIWQIVRHLILWKRAVLQTWDGNPPDGTHLDADDWQEVTGSEAEWENDRRTLLDISAQYLAQAEALDDVGLSRPIVWYTTGQTQPLAMRLVRTTTHDIYHSGQMRYLRALQGRGDGLPANQSMPRSTVIPELPYPDVGEAIAWLGDAFGFTLRLRIGNHRAQLNVADGAVVLTEQRRGDGHVAPGMNSVLVRVEDVDRHHERARQHGARILQAPADYPYGERQYTAEDPAGHRWTFSQTIADVAPENWGGTSGKI